jgi:hypothetical protein
VRTYLKNNYCKKGWQSGSSGRVPQYHQKKKKQKKVETIAKKHRKGVSCFQKQIFCVRVVGMYIAQA